MQMSFAHRNRWMMISEARRDIPLHFGMFPVAESGRKLTNDVGRSPESFVGSLSWYIYDQEKTP